MRHADKIIEAVRTRPFLYDQTLQTFKHIGMKNRNWMEVAKTVYGREDTATVNRVKIQWKSLRDAFVKQQRKRQSSTARVRPYVYETEMQFLMPHILLKEREDCGPEGDGLTVKNFDVKTEDCVSLNASFSGDSQTEIDAERETPAMEEFLWDQSIHPKTTNDRETHPVDAFFHGIAQTVKQLKPATIAKLKKAVANIVMDAELEEIEQNASYS
jgi:hypothetical protein